PDDRERSHHFPAHTRRRADENEISQVRRGLFQTDHHPHCLLARIQIGGKQLHNLLLFRQGLQQLLQPLAVLLSADQIGRAFQVHCLERFIGSQCALAVELLDRAHQTVVLAALTLNALGQLRSQRLHRPSAEILVDIAGGRLQFNVRERRLHAQHAIPHHARTRHHHRQHLLITQSREVNVFQRVLLHASRNRHPHVVRDHRQHPRRPLHELLHIAHALQHLVNRALVLRRKPGAPADLLHVVAVRFRCGHTSRGCVRLLQVPGLGQVRHHVAYGCRTEPLTVGARQRPRSHRLTRGNVVFHDRRQDLVFPAPDLLRLVHGKLRTSLLTTFRCSHLDNDSGSRNFDSREAGRYCQDWHSSYPTAKSILSLADLDYRLRFRATDLLDALDDASGEVIEGLGVRGAFPFEHNRMAGIATSADIRVQLHPAEERQAELLGGPFASAFGKNVNLGVAVGTNEVTHVLHQADDFDLHLAEHLDGLARVLQRNVTGGGDHDRAGNRDGLDERDSHVAGSRRQVNNQVVELSPVHALQKLADHLVQHGATPDQRLVARGQKADRNHLHTVALERLNAVVGQQPWCRARAQHERHVRAVDVGIEQADFVSELAESEGEVHSQCGLADAALSGTDSDNGIYARQRLRAGGLLWAAGSMHVAHGGALLIVTLHAIRTDDYTPR